MDHREIQETFDGTFNNLGMGGAPQPMRDESDGQYRRRLLRLLQPYGSTFREVTLGALPTAELVPIERVIIAEAAAAVRDQSRGDWSDSGKLREIPRDGVSNVVEFAGSPMVWLSHFAAPARAVKKFMDGAGRTIRVNRGTIR